MRKGGSNTERSGSFLIEAILAVAVFALFVTVFAAALFHGREAASLSGNRARAVMLADEGLEATRNIRDFDYFELFNGTHGLVVVGDQWELSGTSDTTDIFTREISISDAGPNRKLISSVVTWQQNPQRLGSVTAVTRLTNWQRTAGPSVTSCNAYAISEGYDSGICRASARQCTNNGEDNLPGGAIHCDGPGQNVCCGFPAM